MKCFAIGDVILPTKYFDIALQGDPLFSSYESTSWMEDLDRAASRSMIVAMIMVMTVVVIMVVMMVMPFLL